MAIKCGTVAIGADLSLGRVKGEASKYYVEKIVDWWIRKLKEGQKKRGYGKTDVKLRVKWLYWNDPRDDTWEPLMTLLEDCPRIVAEYVHTTKKKIPSKRRLMRSYEEAKRELIRTKGINVLKDLDSADAREWEEDAETNASPDPQQKVKKKRKQRKKVTFPANKIAGTHRDDKRRRRIQKCDTLLPRFSIVTSGDVAGYDAVQDPGPVIEPQPQSTRSPSKSADLPTPTSPKSPEGEEKVTARDNGGKIPDMKLFPLTYDQVKVLRYLKADGVIHRCIPESAFMNGEVPQHIGATMDLPELGTVGYWVKLVEEDTYGLVFREVAQCYFPNTLKDYMQNEEQFVRQPICQ